MWVLQPLTDSAECRGNAIPGPSDLFSPLCPSPKKTRGDHSASAVLPFLVLQSSRLNYWWGKETKTSEDEDAIIKRTALTWNSRFEHGCHIFLRVPIFTADSCALLIINIGAALLVQPQQFLLWSFQTVVALCPDYTWWQRTFLSCRFYFGKRFRLFATDLGDFCG